MRSAKYARRVLTVTLCRPHQYGAFEIDGGAVNEAIVRVRRACELSVWLASVTRDELERFRNFIAWLKTGASSYIAIIPS